MTSRSSLITYYQRDVRKTSGANARNKVFAKFAIFVLFRNKHKKGMFGIAKIMRKSERYKRNKQHSCQIEKV